MPVTTGQAVINGALTTLGILEQGGTPSVSDANDALSELQHLWDAWGIDEGLIYSVVQQQFTWQANVKTNAIGPGAVAPFIVAVPTRIYAAYFIPGSGQRVDLDIVNSTAYYSHRDLNASAGSPDELYYDWNVAQASGDATLNLWPQPSVPGTLEIDTAVPFLAWALAGNVNLPSGYEDALNWGLAFRLMPRFGVLVAQEVAQVVTAQAKVAEDRVRKMNEINRHLPPGSEAQPITQAPPEVPSGRP